MSTPIRVLLVDDDDDEVLLLRLVLAEIRADGYALDNARSYEEGMAAALESRHDAILVDYRLGSRDGLQFLREAKERGCRAPIIMLTGMGRYETDLEAMRAGAADYLIKGKYSPELLERSLRYALDRARNQEALRRSQERYRAILEDTRALVFQTDARGCLVFVNEAVARLLNEHASALLGRRALAFLPRASRGAALKAAAGALRRGEVPHLELPYRRADGRGGWLAVTIHPMTSAGAPIGLAGVALDVTARKELETMLLRTERFAAMGQLAAGVVHDLSNPLSIIVGYAQTLLESLPAPDALQNALRGIDRSAQRCRLLVRQLLDFSRGDEGAGEEFDLREVVSAALDLVGVQARLQRVSIEKPECAQPLLLFGRRPQVGQIVVNLCVNALDAMPEGGKLVVSLARADEPGGPCAELRVKDSGPGLAPEVRENLFKPFVTTKAPGKGTGLGLALVSLIVERHGGRVTAESAEGQGTTFIVRLPLAGKAP